MRVENIGRRRALALVVLAGALAAVPAAAQDPRVSGARNAALQWLALTDAGDFAASHETSARKFQALLTPARWADALGRVRSPFGDVVQRTLAKSDITNKFQGQPEGEYVVLVFRTAFTKRTGTAETLTMERESDGIWRVAGYSIR